MGAHSRGRFLARDNPLYRRGKPAGASARRAPAAPDSRAVVLSALAALRQGQNLPEALQAAGIGGLSGRDKAFARRLAQHAARHRRRLEASMTALLQKPSKDPQLNNLLWLGACQLDLADVADHAAVNSTVELAPKRLRGVVNAVLRRRLREPQTAPLAPAVRLSFPDWLDAAIRQDWGEAAEAVMGALNVEPALCLRVNRQQCARDDYRAQLAELGIAAEAWGEDGLVLEQTVALQELPGHDAGRVAVQGAAAQMAASLLRLASGQQVLDACAAPGGKTMHMLELQPGIHCVAVDVDAARLARVAENLARHGLEAELHVGDVAQAGPWVQAYDRILLDAPCSGTGVIGRHPDIKSLRRADDIPRLAQQQGALLEALWPQLKPGGLLLYSTCSILVAENDAVVQAFVAAHADAKPARIELPAGQASAYGWRIAPDRALEGFYYAVLMKQ